jgi:membrane dipeptidase
MRKILKWFIRIFIWVLFFGLIAFFTLGPGLVENALNAVKPDEPKPISQRARTLHASLVIGDWHADSLLWKRNLLDRGSRGHVDFPRLVEGNVAVQVFTAVTKSPSGLNYEANSSEAADQITWLAVGQLWPLRTWDSLFQRAMYQAYRMKDYAEEAPDQVSLILNKSDLASVLARREAGETVVGAILGIEGSHPLEGDISRLDILEDAGYRLFGMTHFFDNEVGGSLHGLSGAGLTEFGKLLVDELDARSMIIDLAHASPAVALDVLNRVSRPVVVSHTGIHSHCPVKRNFEDDLMKRIADAGGLIGIGYWEDVTCDASFDGVAATIKAAIGVVGEDHVSLGSDYDGSVTTHFDTSQLAGLTQALIDAGLTDEQIAKVMGGNMMRFLAENLPD